MSDVTRRDALLAAAAVGVGLAGAATAAAQSDKPKPKPKHDLRRLERQVTDLSNALARLADEKDWKELILIIKRPGWTTPAEFTLVSGMMDSLLAHAKALAAQKTALLAGSREVATRK
jgi:hypothetical protein